MKAVLHLTKSCNLRCRYCYAPSKIKETMSLDTARKGIDLVLGLAKGSACVAYFGGEPLLCFDAIQELTRYAVERARPSGTAMHFRLSTNGLLFDEAKLAFCREHNILFAISLDGDREAHDAQRVLPDGTGSFDALDRKLDLILRYNPHTVVTSVITPPTVPRLESSIRYMWSRGIRFVVHQLDYTHPDWTPALFEALEDSYRRLAAFYLERVRAQEHFHLSLFDDKLKSHASSPVELGTLCDFGAKKLSIAPDGRIFPCVQFVSDRADAQDYCIGDVETGLTERRQQLIAENKRERSECAGCALIGRCSNYCGCLNWQLTGQVARVPPALCAHERMLIPIADALGNTLWDERNARFLKKHYREQAERFVYSFD